jgi:DNA-directed RNA polymerase subunit RPC12/RpoP
MPLCVYLCYTPGCQQKVERWMATSEEGKAERIECPRCGEPMKCAWTGSQAPTPNLKDSSSLAGRPRR